MRLLACLVLSCLAAAFAHAAADPVASVNGVPITRAEFDRALVRGGEGASPAAVRERLIAEELIWQKAKQAGIADGIDRPAAIARYIAQNVAPHVADERELRAQYDRVIAALGPREYRLSLIQVPDREGMRKAQQALQRGEEFAQVAAGHSRAPSAVRGGELDWVSFRSPVREGHTNGVPLPVARAVAAMKPGEVSAPIELADGWALVRLDAARATVLPRFEDVKPELRRQLDAKAFESAMRDFIVTLLKGAQIRVFE